jgi:hypothetical protein
MPSPTFILVAREGQDTLHQEHPFEECNTDDAERKQKVDTATAAALLRSGSARSCEFCEPVPDPSVLNTRGDAP